MPNTNSYMSHTKPSRQKRTYWGHDVAGLLIQWLNQTTGTARNRRIVDLLDHISTYIHATEKAAGLHRSSPKNAGSDSFWWDGKKMPAGGFLATQNPEIDRSAKAIVVTLRRYVLRAELVGCYADRPLFAWRPPTKNRITSADRICIQATPPRVSVFFTEGDAVRRIVELCHEGLIERVRLCACGIWFYAKFSHSKFHTVACQQKAYRDSPAWRAHRCEYMKRLRAMHKKTIFRSTG